MVTGKQSSDRFKIQLIRQLQSISQPAPIWLITPPHKSYVAQIFFNLTFIHYNGWLLLLLLLLLLLFVVFVEI
jgi:hypothetical protein